MDRFLLWLERISPWSRILGTIQSFESPGLGYKALVREEDRRYKLTKFSFWTDQRDSGSYLRIRGRDVVFKKLTT